VQGSKTGLPQNEYGLAKRTSKLRLGNAQAAEL